MYVSGTLKKKTSEFYKPTITLFDKEGIAIKIGSFNYDGELLMTPWEKSSEIKLIKRQEEHIPHLLLHQSPLQCLVRDLAGCD